MLRHLVKVMPVLQRPVMKKRMVLETIDGKRGRHYCEARDDGEADAGQTRIEREVDDKEKGP